jgi:hypothetical protein
MDIEKGKALKITAFSFNFSSAQQTMKYQAVAISSDSIMDGAVSLCRLQGSNLFHVFFIFCTTAHTEQLRGQIRMLSFFIFCTTAHIQEQLRGQIRMLSFRMLQSRHLHNFEF